MEVIILIIFLGIFLLLLAFVDAISQPGRHPGEALLFFCVLMIAVAALAGLL